MKVLGKSVKVQIIWNMLQFEFAGYPAYYFLKDEFDKVSPLD